ncbi:MAG TPA: penicillin-binding transpeptidase domain-containing protein, partial [Candidatus Cryosericum sp.]|nr:penicillin-binding transpeptidase domain-containing protein [Candidatus Cryosericum sp.]
PDPNATPTATPAAAGAETDGDETEDEMETTITKVEFVDRYQSIFDELELTGIDYTVNSVTDGEIIARVNYDLTYHSERAGMDLTYSFTIEANRIEHRWTINWSPSLIFPQMEWGDSLRVGVLQANRGEILCGGEAYAQNVNAITVFCVPSTIPDQETFIRSVAAVPEMEMTEADIRDALKKQRNDFCKLKTFYPDEATMDLKTRLLAIDGIAIDTANYGTLRYYPYGESLCHIIGYAGIISKKEKINYETYGDVRYDAANDRFYTTPTRYNGDSYIGKYGLELLYEDELLGTNGRFTYIQTKDGGSRGMLYSTKAVDGEDLHLTIIPELQERLESVVDTTVYDQSIHGCVIVLNPKTGAIQAMTSWPGFDLNDLSRGIPIEEWEAMQNDPDIPLYNRATQGLYTPGSVFKLMTSAALLETNSMTLNDQFPASEDIVQEDKWFPSEAFLNNLPERASTDSWYDQSQDHFLVRTHSDSRPAPMNMTNSIISSDNLYFSYAAMRMGWTKFQAFMDSIGWNTAITLEAAGTKPRIYWKAGSDGISWQNLAEGGETIWKQDENGDWSEVPNVHLVLDKSLIYGLDVSQPQLHNQRPDTKPLNDYDLAVTGYGQGEILMSPLQMACYASAYANNGVVMQPYLVDSLWHADGTDYSLVEQREPKEYRRILQQSTVDLIYPALLQVCVNGTARWLAKSFINKGPLTLGYTMAGKTGTAEINNDKSKELAWFICWRDNKDGEPVTEENARLVCIMLEVKLPLGDEWAQMKMDIARALLKDDTLNDTEG